MICKRAHVKNQLVEIKLIIKINNMFFFSKRISRWERFKIKTYMFNNPRSWKIRQDVKRKTGIEKEVYTQ